MTQFASGDRVGPAVTVERPRVEETALTATAVLDRETYEAGEAARLLGVHVRTLANWLDGYSGRGKSYPPVLRPASTGSFGAPVVDGIRTEVLFELFVAGDPLDEIADSYDLKPQRVEAAVRYEARRSRPTERAAA